MLFTPGLPLTVVRRALESALKKVWEMVFRGPVGGVVWPRGMGRWVLSRGVRPLDVIDMQEMPELAPEFATQAWESFSEIERETGKSPKVGAGMPTIVSLQGSWAEMVNMETVLEPGFTARRVWGCLLVGLANWGEG